METPSLTSHSLDTPASLTSCLYMLTPPHRIGLDLSYSPAHNVAAASPYIIRLLWRQLTPSSALFSRAAAHDGPRARTPRGVRRDKGGGVARCMPLPCMDDRGGRLLVLRGVVARWRQRRAPFCRRRH